MELDNASLSIGRIERALSRIERGFAASPPRSQPETGGSPGVGNAGANDALRQEVTAVIAELDRLIAEAGRG